MSILGKPAAISSTAEIMVCEEQAAPRRLRVLLSAFAIAPNQGSEPGVGWNTAIRLAQHHDVTVLCGDLGAGRETERTLKEYFKAHGRVHGLSICYVSPSLRTRLFYWLCGRPGLWPLYYSAYHSWQKDAFVTAAALHKGKPFDLVHQLTFASFREPGYLWKLPLPFFWGPISGASSPPLRMLHRGGARTIVRSAANFFQRHFARRSATAARRAAIIWASAEADCQLLKRWGGKVEQQFEVGTSRLSERPRTRVTGETLRLVWSGLHIARKALPIALYTMARLPRDGSFHLDVLGSGPETSKCKALASHLGIGEMVSWHGSLSQPDAVRVMDGGHVLFHTSISEGTPAVIMEALASGLPVICHDACGMHLAVTDQCGVRVRLQDRETSTREFSRAIQQLTDIDLYARLSKGALLRAAELTWDKKIERIAVAYVDLSSRAS